jgi:hypothetical protein
VGFHCVAEAASSSKCVRFCGSSEGSAGVAAVDMARGARAGTRRRRRSGGDERDRRECNVARSRDALMIELAPTLRLSPLCLASSMSEDMPNKALPGTALNIWTWICLARRLRQWRLAGAHHSALNTTPSPVAAIRLLSCLLLPRGHSKCLLSHEARSELASHLSTFPASASSCRARDNTPSRTAVRRHICIRRRRQLL